MAFLTCGVFSARTGPTRFSAGALLGLARSKRIAHALATGTAFLHS